MSEQTRERLPIRAWLAATCACACLVAGMGSSVFAATSTNIFPPDLGVAPPDISTSVTPNVVVTFDDSGSMSWTFMGDHPPYSTWATDLGCTTSRGTTTCTASAGNLVNKNYSWRAGPWACAGVVDPSGQAAIASYAMNGVYYNPNVSYASPKLEDNTDLFPSSSGTLSILGSAVTTPTTANVLNLTQVPVDGIALFQPSNGNRQTAGSVGYNNNPVLNGSATDTGLTNLMGAVTTENVYRCSSKNGSGGHNCATTGTPTSTKSTDNRWQCDSGMSGEAKAGVTLPTSPYGTTNGSPMDGASHTLADGTSKQYGTALATTIQDCGSATDCTSICPLNGSSCKNNTKYYYTVVTTTGGGGPYYWRLKKGVSLKLDSMTAKPTCTSGGSSTPTATQASNGTCDAGSGVATLYTPSNWEAVPVVADASGKYANFAYWYAFYRTRSQMARTSISRVFGPIGGTTNGTIRVAWQNLGNNVNWNAPNKLLKVGTTPIQSLDDNTTYTQTNASGSNVSGTVGFRQAFFNWIYNVNANDSTPSRDAIDMAGKFYSSNGTTADCSGGSCGAPTTTTAKNADPYWQSGSPGQELACRQNYQVLVTDGYWNSDNTTHGAGSYSQTGTSYTLPDKVSYDPSSALTKVFSDGPQTDPGSSTDTATMGNIAFHYWANNLRPDLVKYNSDGTMATNSSTGRSYNHVPAYLTDTTVGVTGAVVSPVATSTPPGSNVTPEVYFNPENDPATWPHLVNFMVTLGAGGVLSSTPSDPDCNTPTAHDYCNLRKDATNSSGAKGWPPVDGSGNGIPGNVDDLWRAAINSRGGFFIASDPSSLVSQLTGILNTVLTRAGQSTAASVSSSVLTGGSYGYSGGYSSADWSGSLYKDTLDSNGNPSAAQWDAGCILSGGTFTPGTGSFGPNGSCAVPLPAPNATGRNIYTSVTSGGALTAVNFSTAGLAGKPEIGYLGLDPNSTKQTTSGNVVTISGTADSNANDRIDYLAGKRNYESMANANGIQFRSRGSLLGAIVNSQVVYEGGPSAGWLDIYPAGSPEQTAASSSTCQSTPASTGCHSYESYVSNNKSRAPRLYVGANDGMLHAFDANTGAEVWAYVPNALYANGQLNELTNASDKSLVPTVDATPIVQDVFLKDNAWHTVLVGSLRLGARAIYALDVTDPTANGASSKFMWEFDSSKDTTCANCLGYTYSSANIARLKNGKWVVLVASGYFPAQLPIRQNGTNSIADTTAAATSNVTHLWVLDLNDGSIIRRFDTPSSVTSFGLSTPDLVDFGGDQIDDVAVAGDLAGNVWRFDLSDPTPANWKVDQLFQSYPAGTTAVCDASHTTGIGCEPISVMPVAFPDPVTGSVIYVFGSGKYLGNTDKTSSSVPTTQHFFGVRDYGTPSSNYPVTPDKLVAQTLTDTAGVRSVTNNPVPSTKQGWSIALPTAGERDVTTAVPLFASGAAILTSLFPPSTDPCSTDRTGAIMAVGAATGGPVLATAATASGTVTGSYNVGGTVSNPPITGAPSVISLLGGGKVLIPGLKSTTTNNAQAFPGVIWRRSSWDKLLNNL